MWRLQEIFAFNSYVGAPSNIVDVSGIRNPIRITKIEECIILRELTVIKIRLSVREQDSTAIVNLHSGAINLRTILTRATAAIKAGTSYLAVT